MPDENNSYGLAAMFVAHAQGYVSRRGYEERRKRIIQYMAANKYTISDEEFENLDHELGEIEKALDEI